MSKIAILYIGSALAQIVLLIVVAFSDLERIGIDAVEEAYMTKLIDNNVPQRAIDLDQSENAFTETESPSTSTADARWNEKGG